MVLFLPILIYAIWANIFPLGKIALEYSSPLFLTCARMLLAGMLIMGFLTLFKRGSFKVPLKLWFSFACLGFFSVYLSNFLEFWGLQYLSAAKTCFIYGLSPFFAAIFSFIHFKEKLNGRKILGLFIGLIGLLVGIIDKTESKSFYRLFSITSLPELAMIGAAASGSYGWILLRRLIKDSSISILLTNGASMLFGGLMALAHLLLLGDWNFLPNTIANIVPMLQILLLMTLISNIICYNFYGMLLKRFTATFLSFVGLLSPIFASLSGWILLSESPSVFILLSTAIMLLGLWLVYSSEIKQGYISARIKRLQLLRRG